MQHKIDYGTKQIVYSIKRQERKTLAIQVHPDKSVVVIAPTHVSDKAIEDKLKQKAKWIFKKQLYFASFHPRTTERKFVGGESHLYLGRQYKLKLVQGKEETVKVFQGIMQVKSKATKKETIALLIEAWHRERAEFIFTAILEKVFPKFSRYKIAKPSIIIRKMSTRWGSCTAGGKIILNPVLVKAPKSCIEYVVVHELVHLVYRNHTKEFYKLLNKQLPDWEKQKAKLEYLLA